MLDGFARKPAQHLSNARTTILMIAKTSTQRSTKLRACRAEAGLSEVRGIWAPSAMHAAIREAAAKMLRKQAKKEKP